MVDGDPAARRRGGGSSGNPGRASPSTSGRERCHGREREAPGARVLLPSLPPTIYRPPGGRRPWRSHLQGGTTAKGGNLPRKRGGGAPTPRVSNPRRRGPKGGCTSPPGAGSHAPSAHGALRDRWPHPVDPRDPSGGPGTIPVTPETFPMAETALPIYKSLPPDHSGTPRDVRDLIRDSEQLSGYRILISLQP